MTDLAAGITEAEWLTTPAAVCALILAQQQLRALREENDQLHIKLSAMATELTGLGLDHSLSLTSGKNQARPVRWVSFLEQSGRQ